MFTAAEDHNCCHCCQFSTGNLSLTMLSIVDWKNVIWSQLLLQHLGGWVQTQCEQHENILPSISGSGCCWWCDNGGDIFLAHFGFLITIRGSLITTSYSGIVHYQGYPFMTTVSPSAGQWDLSDVSNWILEPDNEFAVFKWPPWSPKRNSMDPLCDAVDLYHRSAADKTAATASCQYGPKSEKSFTHPV